MLGLRGGQLFGRERFFWVRLVQRRDVFSVRGVVKLFELFTRSQVCRWFKRLYGLRSGDVPGRFRRIKLPELRPGDVRGIRRKRMLELLGGQLPSIDGCFELRRMRRRNFVERDWCSGVEHLCSLLGGFLLFDFGGHCMRGLCRGEFFARCGNVELHGVHRRSVRGGDERIGVHIVHFWPVPNGDGCDGLRELPFGPVWNHFSCKHK